MQEYPEILKNKIESVLSEKGFFLDLPPMESGIYAVKEIMNNGSKVFICSSGIYRNKDSLGEKRLWIEKYLGEDLARNAIFIRDKTLIKGHFLIDDNPQIGLGVFNPEWQHVIFDQSFNRDIKNKLRIKSDWSNWREVII